MNNKINLQQESTSIRSRPVLDFWPMGKDKPPRMTQVEALKWIESLPSNIKYILCEIPVGGGKSPLGINLSGYMSQSFGNAFILTPQKILQKQYENDFDKKILASIYGKSNYTCNKKKTNCDIGADIKPPCANCPAREALKIALSSPNMVMNYTLALLYFMLLDEKTMPKRNLMIFDECHTLENHLTEFNAITISERKCKQYNAKWNNPLTFKDAMGWIENVYYKAVDNYHRKLAVQMDDLSNEITFNDRALTTIEHTLITDFKEVVKHRQALLHLISMPYDEVIDRYVFVKDKGFFKLKELYGKNVFHSFVKQRADRFLFMSSTILDKDAFCRDLGLNPDEAAFISLTSEFDKDNRPVFFLPTMKMTYGWDKSDRRSERQDMVRTIIDICKEHKDDSGIIHTGSFNIADWLVTEMNGVVPHRILHHNPSSKLSRDDVISDYMELSVTQPTILISPSITEGLDLKDDKARFAIIVKVPYPNLSDAWVKRRMEISDEWYKRQALISIIQGCGRIVRHHDDWGYTYILDSSFQYLLHSMRKHVPEWWIDGYQKY